MYLKLIACSVMQREFASLAAHCPNTIDISNIRQQYHEVPVNLTKALQEEIDRIDNNTDSHTNDLTRRNLDAILLGYGLCSNAIVGLKSKKYKIVVPRAHDCATLVMGSKEAYQQYFETYKGSYFYTRGWYELGAFTLDDEGRLEEIRRFYMEKYQDEEIVDELMELELDMMKNYKYITYVRWPGLSNEESYIWAKQMCEGHGWIFNEMEGSDSLLKDMLWGNWDPDKFLVLEPGQTLTPSYGEDIIQVKN